MSKTSEMLAEMAKLTALSGRISEIQEVNFKTYPFIYFNGVTKVEIDYDLTTRKSANDEPTTNSSKVTYKIETSEENDHIERRCKALQESVKMLLWKDMSVKIYINGKIESAGA